MASERKTSHQWKMAPLKKSGNVPPRGNALGPSRPAAPGSGGPVFGICLFLVAITLAVFGGTLRY